MFLKTVFENTRNIVSMFFENCFCSQKLMFSCFSYFLEQKKDCELKVFSMSLFFLFLKTKTVFKNHKQIGSKVQNEQYHTNMKETYVGP